MVGKIGNGVMEVREKEVAKNGNKRAEIGAKWLRLLLKTKLKTKNGAYVRNERYSSVVY